MLTVNVVYQCLSCPVTHTRWYSKQYEQILYIHTLIHSADMYTRTPGETLVLMHVVWNEPENAVWAEEGIETEAGQEQDRKHKEPVDASDRNRRQRSFLQDGLIWTRFKTYSTVRNHTQSPSRTHTAYASLHQFNPMSATRSPITHSISFESLNHPNSSCGNPFEIGHCITMESVL